MTTNPSRGARGLLPILTAIAIGLFAAIPLFRGLPEGADTLLHFYRAVQVEHLFEQGILFSPWAPDLAYGYGYPLFNYYAPLAYYPVSILSFLGLDTSSALLFVYGLALVTSSAGMYLWTRDFVPDPAALVAAAIYVLSPYLIINAVQRGALAETAALSLLPLTLWATRNYIVGGRWTHGFIALLAYGSLVLTHNITALIFTPILAAYVLLVSYRRGKERGETLARR